MLNVFINWLHENDIGGSGRDSVVPGEVTLLSQWHEPLARERLFATILPDLKHMPDAHAPRAIRAHAAATALVSEFLHGQHGNAGGLQCIPHRPPRIQDTIVNPRSQISELIPASPIRRLGTKNRIRRISQPMSPFRNRFRISRKRDQYANPTRHRYAQRKDTLHA